MGEAFRNPEELEIVIGRLGFEVKSRPFSKVGRIASKIYSNVPDMAGEDADELALGLAELVMQPTEHTFN